MTHVVQLMQAKKTSVGELLIKYQKLTGNESNPTPCTTNGHHNQTNDEDTDVFCSVGKFGLIISTLEQIGYMRRFYDEYCTKPNPEPTCSKKLKKYYTR